MDIRQLRYFVLVAKYMNFTAASKEALIDQSALSKQIADLETRVGQKLFTRNTRSVQLTAAGKEFLKAATEIIIKSEEAITRAHLAAKGNIGSLSIGYVGAMEKETEKLPKFIKEFHSNYPKINLSPIRFNLGPLNQALLKGEVDIAFTFSQELDEKAGLKWKTCPFYPDSMPMCVVVPHDHPIAKKSKVCLSSLGHVPFITLSDAPFKNDYLQYICDAHEFYPNIVCEVSMMENLLFLVETGIGIAILSQHTQAFASQNLRFIEIEDINLRLSRVVAWKEANPNPLIPLFLDILFRKA